MPAVLRDDPYAGYNFEVIVTGISDDGDRGQGLVRRGVAAWRWRWTRSSTATAREDITVRKLPGLKKFTNITLKRGLIGDLAFWNWVVEGHERPGRAAPKARSCCSTRTGAK